MTRQTRPARTAKPRPPLDAAHLRDLALHYAGRFATTRAKLAIYLHRKLKERGWAGAERPDVEAIVGKLAELRYVDDAAYAQMKAGSLVRAGYGTRRVAQALRGAGIEPSDGQAAIEEAASARWQAAEKFARRKRIGPFAPSPPDPKTRERQIAAFLRAGHDMGMARTWVDARPGEPPEPMD